MITALPAKYCLCNFSHCGLSVTVLAGEHESMKTREFEGFYGSSWILALPRSRITGDVLTWYVLMVVLSNSPNVI